MRRRRSRRSIITISAIAGLLLTGIAAPAASAGAPGYPGIDVPAYSDINESTEYLPDDFNLVEDDIGADLDTYLDGYPYDDADNPGLWSETDGYLTIESLAAVQNMGLMFNTANGLLTLADANRTPVPNSGPNGIWSWDSQTRTLVFDGFEWETRDANNPALTIQGSGQMTLRLQNHNTFASASSHGIRIAGGSLDVTITGPGSLQVTSGILMNAITLQIDNGAALTISGATVTTQRRHTNSEGVVVGDAAQLKITSGTISINRFASGVNSQFAVQGGTVNIINRATIGSSARFDIPGGVVGIAGGFNLNASATLNVSGGRITSQNAAAGINMATSAQLNVSAGEASFTGRNAVNMNNANTRVTVRGGKLVATGTTTVGGEFAFNTSATSAVTLSSGIISAIDGRNLFNASGITVTAPVYQWRVGQTTAFPDSWYSYPSTPINVPANSRSLEVRASRLVDVRPDSPFLTAIEWMIERGISTAWPDGTFRPGFDVTREAMAAFLYRAAGWPEFTPPPTPTFADVPLNSAFFKEVEWLATQGITDGWTVDGVRLFRPADPITREAMAAFLYRAAGEPAFTPPVRPTFVDVPSTSPFFKHVEWMAATGISTGWPDGTFRPSAFVTREATAAFLQRASIVGGGVWGS